MLPGDCFLWFFFADVGFPFGSLMNLSASDETRSRHHQDRLVGVCSDIRCVANDGEVFVLQPWVARVYACEDGRPINDR